MEECMRVCIMGHKKTGTTGLYNLIKSSMLPEYPDTVFSFEPKGPGVFEAFFTRAKSDVSFLTKCMHLPKYFKFERIKDFDKKIMIVRDPRDRIVSMFLFRALARRVDDIKAYEAFLDLVRKKEEDPKSISLKDLNIEADELKVGSTNWERIKELNEFQIFTLHDSKFFTILYEDFVEKKYDSLQEYMGLPISEAPQGNKWLSHIVRSKQFGEWKSWFTKDDVDFFRPLLKDYMDTFGYEDNWDIPDNPEINRDNASGYIQRKYESRKEQFNLISTDDEIKSLEDLDLLKGRAEDGRVADLLRVGLHYLDNDLDGQDLSLAYRMFERGYLMGNKKCFGQIKKMIKKGYKPDGILSPDIEQLTD